MLETTLSYKIWLFWIKEAKEDDFFLSFLCKNLLKFATKLITDHFSILNNVMYNSKINLSIKSLNTEDCCNNVAGSQELLHVRGGSAVPCLIFPFYQGSFINFAHRQTPERGTVIRKDWQPLTWSTQPPLFLLQTLAQGLPHEPARPFLPQTDFSLSF